MFEEHVLEKLVPEMIGRLCMTEDELDYEIKVPRPEYYLSITGGAKSPEFTLTPVAVDEDDSRHAGDPLTFVMYAGSDAKCKSDPSLTLFGWLRSNPWAAIKRPESSK